jgi:hypothetical protein
MQDNVFYKSKGWPITIVNTKISSLMLPFIFLQFRGYTTRTPLCISLTITTLKNGEFSNALRAICERGRGLRQLGDVTVQYTLLHLLASFIRYWRERYTATSPPMQQVSEGNKRRSARYIWRLTPPAEEMSWQRRLLDYEEKFFWHPNVRRIAPPTMRALLSIGSFLQKCCSFSDTATTICRPL